MASSAGETGDTQIELDDIGEDMTADDRPKPDADTVKMGEEGDTVPLSKVPPAIVPPPDGALSLEQFAYLYASHLNGPQAHAAALDETRLTSEQYDAWRLHWESRMMHRQDERDRFFKLVAKLRA